MSKPRGVLVAGNWKMNSTRAETEIFFSSLATHSSWKKSESALTSMKLRAVIFPPMLSLETAQRAVGHASLLIDIGAQNVHWEKRGAFTGEISGPMLQEIGLKWALVGHSERRQYFGETDETAKKRTESLLEQGFHVILCVGETRVERETGQTEAVITRQLNAVLGQPMMRFLTGTLIIAYEPVWAIGTGLTATPAQAEEAHALIRALLKNRFGASAAELTTLLYGGSVTPDNMDSLLACPNIDGALVGGASLKIDGFAALIMAGTIQLKGDLS